MPSLLASRRDYFLPATGRGMAFPVRDRAYRTLSSAASSAAVIPILGGFRPMPLSEFDLESRGNSILVAQVTVRSSCRIACNRVTNCSLDERTLARRISHSTTHKGEEIASAIILAGGQEYAPVHIVNRFEKVLPTPFRLRISVFWSLFSRGHAHVTLCKQVSQTEIRNPLRRPSRLIIRFSGLRRGKMPIS